MKTIYILLTRSQTIVSRMVSLFTGAQYTHISIAFESDLNPLYSSSRKNGRTILPAGPCHEYINKGYFGRHMDIPCILYTLEVSDEQYEAAHTQAKNIIANADIYHFNIIGLITCRLGICFHRENHYFCSQLAGEILKRSGALVIPREPVLLKPMDFTEFSELTCIFIGTIRQLNEKIFGPSALPYPNKMAAIADHQ